MTHKNPYEVVEKNGKFYAVKHTHKDSDFFFGEDTREKAQKRCDENNSRWYLQEEFTQEEIKSWFDKINFQPLFDRTSDLIKSGLDFTVKLDKDPREGYKYFKIKSGGNLVEQFPILKCAWKEMHVETFNASICCDEDGLYLWGNLDFHYEHWDCGSNGAHILDFEYSDKDGWKITTNEELAKLRGF